MNHPSFWILFNLFVIVMLFLDLKVFHAKDKEISIKEAIGWSVFWIALALSFNLWIFFAQGKEPALTFLTGYLVEMSLSVDNLFVFLLIFKYFRVPGVYQHKILFWGILGAVVMRAGFILGGIALFNYFTWLSFIFGGFLIYTGYKLFTEKEKEIHPEDNILIKLFCKFFPVIHTNEEGKFWIIKDGKRYATTILIVLISIDITDLIFAVDSIPAILAITRDPFIIYTSNVFAILGLRTFYFALAHMMKLFEFLHYGLGVILMFVGFKMVAEKFVHIPTTIALGVIVLILGLSIGLSVLFAKKKLVQEERD